MAFALKRIFQLDSLTTPKTQLAGSYTVFDIPLGPVAGGYKTVRGTPEELAAYLADQGLPTARLVDALTLADAQALLAGANLTPGVLYVITGNWNFAGTDTTVYVQGLAGNAFAALGTMLAGTGAGQAVFVNVAAGAYSASIDLLALTTTQMDEVMALAYTDCDADPAASPAWSYPGMQFDAIDNGHNCHFYCTRGTYDPAAAAGTTGAGPAWHYSKKQA